MATVDRMNFDSDGNHITDKQQVLISIHASDEFSDLRRRLRNFVFPMSALFLVWYLLFVLLGTYASEWMATPIFGNVNIGLILGIGQFVTTLVITGIYVRFADKVLDPRARALRDQAEGAAK